MPRSSGTMVLVAGNPVISGATLTSFEYGRKFAFIHWGDDWDYYFSE